MSDELTKKEMLVKSEAELEDRLVKTDDVDEIGKVIEQLRIHKAKKDIIRANKLSSMLDKTVDALEQRIENRPDEFTNKELMDLANVTNNIANNANMSINALDEKPLVQFNQQNNINVNSSENGLDRDSKEKVMDAIAKILKNIDTPTQVIDADETKKEKDN